MIKTNYFLKTFILTLVLLLGINATAQYTADGIYTIQCVGTSKYMSGGTAGSPMPMITTITDDAKFNIVANGTKFNIITTDGLYLASINGNYGTLIDNTLANRNSTTSGALVDFLDQGANPYRFEATPDVTDPAVSDVKGDGTVKAFNGQRGGNTQVGVGTSTGGNYQWNIVAVPSTIPAATALVNPIDGQKTVVNEVISLSATANAATGNTISKVEFYEGANLLGEGSLVGDNYVYDWTPTTLATYSITSKVTESDNETTSSAAASLEVIAAIVNPVKSVHIDFETADVNDWTIEAAGALAIVPGKGIDGSKAMAVTLTASGQVLHAYSTLVSEMVDVETGDNVHIISGVATSDISAGQPQVSFRTDAWVGPTPGFGYLSGVANDEFTTKSFGRNPNGNYGAQFAPRLRAKANGGACIIYYDNMVLYAHSSATPDLTGPASASAFSYGTVEPGSIEFSWTDGADGETELTKTLVLRKTIGSSAPVLTDQVNYKANDVVGDWTVVAVVDAGTEFYADNTVNNSDEYTYAIVGRDLAYNYSSPITSNSTATGLSTASQSTFKCYGTTGAVQFNNLTQGAQVSIYALSGKLVYSKAVNNENLSVTLPKGMYIVSAQNKNVKVIVK